MRCIQLGSSVGCSRVPQVHFVRKHFVPKQTMCKSLYTYLTICFAFEKPRWLLHNTADRAETVFSHLKPITKRSNRNHVITFDSQLKTALSLHSYTKTKQIREQEEKKEPSSDLLDTQDYL